MVTRLFPMVSPVIFTLVVIVLGNITPGYSQVNYTISRLAIEKYGWIQSLNFLQFALGISLLGAALSSDIKQSMERATVRTIFSLCAMVLVVAAIFPTDPIENIPLRLSIFTPLGLVHAGTVLLFLAASPIGIHRLAAILAADPKYKHLSNLTRIIGYSTFAASVLWFICFALDIGLDFRGITQKMIALPVLYWIMRLSYTAQKSHRV